MNERILRLKPYPTTRLDKLKLELRASGKRILDFGTGDPNEPTPAFIRQALIDAVPEVGRYASVQGTDELRAAAAGYVQRRFGVELDPGTEILPTSGSMEAVFHLPMILIDPRTGRDRVVYGEPAYPVFELGTYYAEAREHPVSLTAENRYLLSPDAVGEEVLSETAIVILNYPHNPTGQELPDELFERWIGARNDHGFVLVSDEVYCDIYFDEPPRSLLEFGREGCLAIHSLSKRSGMTGYQSGFMAGDPELIAHLKRFRSGMGVSSPVWTQAAATAAWSDHEHVAARRASMAAKREVLLEMLAARGVRVYPGTASLFLWVQVPDGHTDVGYAERLLEQGIVVSPGSYYGPDQQGFIRLALVPRLAECREAAELWPR